MKKSHIITIVITVIIIIFGVFSYFYFYPEEEAITIQVNEPVPKIDLKEKNEDVEEKNNDKIKLEKGTNSNEEDDNTEPEEEDNLELEEDYSDMENNIVEITDTKENKSNNISTNTVVEEIEEDIPEIEDKDEVKVLTLSHHYRRDFRNPFKEYRIMHNINSDSLTIEGIKEMVPFDLQGIIGNNYGRLAVINYQNRTRIIREKTEIEDFWIIDILDNGLVMVYKGVQFYLEMESGINEGL